MHTNLKQRDARRTGPCHRGATVSLSEHNHTSTVFLLHQITFTHWRKLAKNTNTHTQSLTHLLVPERVTRSYPYDLQLWDQTIPKHIPINIEIKAITWYIYPTYLRSFCGSSVVHGVIFHVIRKSLVVNLSRTKVGPHIESMRKSPYFSTVDSLLKFCVSNISCNHKSSREGESCSDGEGRQLRE